MPAKIKLLPGAAIPLRSLRLPLALVICLMRAAGSVVGLLFGTASKVSRNA